MPPGGINNPVEMEMMDDIRNAQHRAPGTGANSFRPSWVRHTVDDMAPQRQERHGEWTAETPRTAQDNMDSFYTTYQGKTQLTLNEFGKGGLPYDDQIRVRPDGLDPVASNRQPTARYNQYALGEDLTQTTRDDGRIRGIAAGQGNRGLSTREGAWEVMPTRDIQMQPSSSLSGGTSIRSGGRGQPLPSFAGRLGNAPSPLTDEPIITRDGLQWDNGPTAKVSVVHRPPVRPDARAVDKHEDLDALRAGTGVSKISALSSTYQGFRGTSYDATPRVPEVNTVAVAQTLGPRENLMQSNAGKAAESTSWRFSFDIKKLFDMAPAVALKNRNSAFSTKEEVRGNIVDTQDNKVRIPALPSSANDRLKTTPHKKVVLVADDEKRKHGVADGNRRTTDLEPVSKNVGVFGASVYKTDTSTDQKKIATSTIRTTKKIGTEQSAPLGNDLSGKNPLIKKSGSLAKWSAQGDGILYNNDHLLDKAGILSEPRRAPKGTTPDYVQPKVSTMRNAGEFRRR